MLRLDDQVQCPTARNSQSSRKRNNSHTVPLLDFQQGAHRKSIHFSSEGSRVPGWVLREECEHGENVGKSLGEGWIA